MSIFHKRSIKEPPSKLDGAQVLLWAYAPRNPFFVMEYSDGRPYKPIHGFAVCRYQGEEQYYKFSCDAKWNVENDSVHAALEEAVTAAENMSTEPITWNRK